MPLSKKGIAEDIMRIILGAIVLGVGIWLIYAYLIHGAGTSIAHAQSCSVLAVGVGQCKVSCDTGEVPFKNIGCSGAQNICCVSSSQNTLALTFPASYGGNYDYNFNVVYDGVNLDSLSSGGQCKSVSQDNMAWSCKPNQVLSVVFKVGVTNTGKQDIPLEAWAFVVTNDNPANTLNYNSPGHTTISSENKGEVYVNVPISAEQSQANSYVKIYPYAICDSTGCKTTDLDSRGVFRGGGSISPVIITFNLQ